MAGAVVVADDKNIIVVLDANMTLEVIRPLREYIFGEGRLLQLTEIIDFTRGAAGQCRLVWRDVSQTWSEGEHGRDCEGTTNQ